MNNQRNSSNMTQTKTADVNKKCDTKRTDKIVKKPFLNRCSAAVYSDLLFRWTRKHFSLDTLAHSFSCRPTHFFNELPKCCILFKELWMVEPNSAAGQSVVLLFNRLGQLILCQRAQQSLDVVALELGSPRVPDQDPGTVSSDTVVQPGVKAFGESFVIEHVAQEDQVEALDLGSDHVFRHTNRWFQAVQLRVHLCGNGCNCNTKHQIGNILPCK